MFKKITCIFLVFVLAFACLGAGAGAAQAKELKFDSDGEFVIMHLCDCQDKYPASKAMLTFINEALEKYQPDLVILGGDNTVGPKETKAQAVEELVKPFVDHEVYFTLVFGNHDHEQGVSEDELLTLYQQYGGEYCLAYDEIPALHGTATHSLPVYASTGDKVAFNLYMFDSGSYVYDESGKELGYDCVTADQIDWYKQTSARLETENGAKVPAMSFQHIVVGEVYDELFYESPIFIDSIMRQFNGKTYSFLPRLGNIKSGYLYEFPCPGYYNLGQFDSFVERGDMLAVFSGHDHMNTYVVEREGVDIVNTPGATFNSYGTDGVRGCRIITLNETNLWEYETEVVTVAEMATQKDSEIPSQGEISNIMGYIVMLGNPILSAIVTLLGLFAR